MGMTVEREVLITDFLGCGIALTDATVMPFTNGAWHDR